MDYLVVILVAAAVFGLCWLVDKGFTKLFRSQAQHRSGLAVRLNKRYGSIGLILAVLGLAALFAGLNGKDGLVLMIGGGLIIATGIGLVVYYMTFGVFYEEDAFILTTFGKADVTYAYKDIVCQQLYNNQGHTLIELHLSDGRVIHLQESMNGAIAFLDYAFSAWCKQKGKAEEECTFHDPGNSCWFPSAEDL